MKVAVCLVGQPRTYEVCAKNILDVFSWNPKVKVDYFIHTWGKNEGNAVPYSEANTEKLKQDLTEFYHPRQMEIQEGWENIKFPMTWTVSRALKMMTATEDLNNFRYDWVFVSRLDWMRYGFRVPYDKILAEYSQDRRELWGGYWGIDSMDCDGKFYVRQEDFSYSFNSLTARIWSQLYEDREALVQAVNQNLDSFRESELHSRVEHCQECWFAIEAVLHNIEIKPGFEILLPGCPIRPALGNCIGHRIYEPEVWEKVCKFMEIYGWYYTEDQIQTYFNKGSEKIQKII